MTQKKPKILVILGPTSSGKSGIAIRLARKFNGEILSADSRQIYRGLDIGTGKVPSDHSLPHSGEMSQDARRDSEGRVYISSGIPHYGIDIISPRNEYNSAKFKKYADRVIADLLKRGKLPIICGGTGFWIRAIVDNVDYPEVKPNWQLRQQLNKKSAEELFIRLQKIDPGRAKNIDAKNKVRLIRAIEICKTLGRVPDDKCRTLNTKYSFLQIGIKLTKEKLHRNIRKRLQRRFEAGMIAEVKKLHRKDKISWKRLESFGLGYSLIPKYLRGEIASQEELFEKIFQAEKNYAKRQMTWFSAQSRTISDGKKDKRIVWLENYKDIEKEIKLFLE